MADPRQTTEDGPQRDAEITSRTGTFRFGLRRNKSAPRFDWALVVRDGTPLPDTVRERVTWYESNARYQRSAYYASEITIILLSAAIPATAALWADPRLGAILGTLVVIAGGVRQLYRWAENWVRSSQTSNELQSEVAKWSQGVAPYESATVASSVLVDRTEAIVNAETSRWATTLITNQAGPSSDVTSGRLHPADTGST